MACGQLYRLSLSIHRELFWNTSTYTATHLNPDADGNAMAITILFVNFLDLIANRSCGLAFILFESPRNRRGVARGWVYPAMTLPYF